MVRTHEDAVQHALAARTNTPDACQAWTRGLFLAPSAGDQDHDGDADAVDGWESEPKSARHTDRHPAYGAPVAWGGGFGHRAIYVGGGMIRSTDAGGRGRVATVPLSWPEVHWGKRWLGWSDTIDGLPIPGIVKPKPGGPSTGRLPVDVLDGSHWNVFTVAGLQAAKKAGAGHWYFKCTEGLDFPDAKYDTNRATAKAAGGRSTAYHFARPRRSNGTLQAKFFLAHAKIKPGSDDRVMLDLEDNGGKSRAALTTWVGQFVKEVERVLGPGHLIYTPFDLDKTFGWMLWVARYHPHNALPRICEPWPMWTVRQFSNGVIGDPHTFPGVSKVDLSNVVGSTTKLHLPPFSGPDPDPHGPPVTPKGALDFRVHLVPGNKVEHVDEVKYDMGLVLKTSGDSAIVFNTERESPALRKAVSDGLGYGWTRAIENENTIAYGPNWHQAPGHLAPRAMLLAKEDPSMAGVSPRRYLDKAYLEHGRFMGTPLGLFDTHLLSEANCQHIHVKGRAWREKMWPIQVNDVLDEVERVHDSGVPIVLAGDWNTGIYFTGKQLFALLSKRFGKQVIHVHNGALDHIFAISTDKVKLSEIGVETMTNNASDHDMVTATIRAQLVKGAA